MHTSFLLHVLLSLSISSIVVVAAQSDARPLDVPPSLKRAFHLRAREYCRVCMGRCLGWFEFTQMPGSESMILPLFDIKLKNTPPENCLDVCSQELRRTQLPDQAFTFRWNQGLVWKKASIALLAANSEVVLDNLDAYLDELNCEDDDGKADNPKPDRPSFGTELVDEVEEDLRRYGVPLPVTRPTQAPKTEAVPEQDKGTSSSSLRTGVVGKVSIDGKAQDQGSNCGGSLTGFFSRIQGKQTANKNCNAQKQQTKNDRATTKSKQDMKDVPLAIKKPRGGNNGNDGGGDAGPSSGASKGWEIGREGVLAGPLEKGVNNPYLAGLSLLGGIGKIAGPVANTVWRGWRSAGAL